jgi:hypothetical protein
MAGMLVITQAGLDVGATLVETPTMETTSQGSGMHYYKRFGSCFRIAAEIRNGPCGCKKEGLCRICRGIVCPFHAMMSPAQPFHIVCASNTVGSSMQIAQLAAIKTCGIGRARALLRKAILTMYMVCSQVDGSQHAILYKLSGLDLHPDPREHATSD